MKTSMSITSIFVVCITVMLLLLQPNTVYCEDGQTPNTQSLGILVIDVNNDGIDDLVFMDLQTLLIVDIWITGNPHQGSIDYDVWVDIVGLRDDRPEALNFPN